MWKNLVIGSACLFALFSCNNKLTFDELEFRTTQTLPAKLISESSPLLGYPYDMFVSDSDIYVLCLMNGKWIHSFNKNSGEETGSFVNSGRGPGECVMCSRLYFNEDSKELFIFDTVQEKLVIFSVQSKDISYISEKSFSDIGDTVFYNAWPISSDSYLANCQQGTIVEGLTRFQIYSNDGILLQECNKIPDLKGDDIYTYTQSSFSMSPNRRHLVNVTLMGEILDIYEIVGNTMNKTVEKVFSMPNIRYNDGVVYETKNTRWGFPFVASDNDFIYASLTDDVDPNKYNKIAIFNWNGEGIVKIETDYNVLRLYPYRQNIYAIVADSLNQLYFAVFSSAIPNV